MEIPGYEIEREIGRGGMARVYLAVQTKFGRWVALKVVSSDYAKDDQFRKRFLQESRINGQLTHPNIVQVHDVGAHGNLLYLVMEYLSGGDLNARLDRGMHIRELVKVVKDIGRALDYAHDKRVVHRDIKPENILFRDDGSAVLTDFGIARLALADLTLTRTGTVVGTPQYMSPEQAAGHSLDGRSDLYSLGVVFYRMLTGDVPYKAESAVAIGVKHLQEPIPKLPSYMAPFQEIIDRALAKSPDARFQSGAEMGDALERIEAGNMVPNATIRTQAVTTQEIRAVGSTLRTAVREQPRGGSRLRRGVGWRWRAALPLTLVAVLVLSLSWILTQRPEWVSQALAQIGITDELVIEDAWNSAQSLHDDPNQSLASIVAAYRRVIDLSPDHLRARQSLTGLASEWKVAIRSALANGNLTLAQTKLNESRTAFPEDREIDALEAELDNRQRAQSLLASTQELLRSRGLEDTATATAAIQAYQEVLRLVPTHQQARIELNQLAERYSTLAMSAAQGQDIDIAISYLDRAMAANPDSDSLGAVRDTIRDATVLKDRTDVSLAAASEYRAEGQLIEPVGANAAELYRRVLATDPDNPVAQQGLVELDAALTAQSRAMLRRNDFDGVAALIDRASAVGIDAAVVQQIREQLRQSSDRQSQIDGLLTQARERIALGYLTEPEGQDAVSALRQVQQLDPGNAEATAQLNEIARTLAIVADQAYEVGMLAAARKYLDLALTVTPDVPDWRAKREAWLAAEVGF